MAGGEKWKMAKKGNMELKESNNVDELILTLQSLSVYDVVKMLHCREAESIAQLHHQHTMIGYLYRKQNATF